MSGLINNGGGFHSDREASQRCALYQLKFIHANETAFVKYASVKDALAFDGFRQIAEWELEFTPEQKTYIDEMYETTMKGFGLPSYEGMLTERDTDDGCDYSEVFPCEYESPLNFIHGTDTGTVIRIPENH